MPKQKGIFLISSSNGSATQTPSFRVRLASNRATIALVRSHRGKLAQYILNNPQSAERADLMRQLAAYGYGHREMLEIISK